VHLEGADRMVGVGGDEHRRRRPRGTELLEQVEAVDLRHLDVEEEYVGPRARDRLDSLGPAALADDLDLGIGGEQQAHDLARERLVVDDEDLEAHDARLHGIVTDARTPPSSWRSEKLWRAP
jgi:hypothetical protein